MKLPVEYDHGDPSIFGGATAMSPDFGRAAAVILPIPFDRTTSYVPGTRNGPREIIQASSHMELWDDELQKDVHEIGIYTMPEMELPFGEMAEVVGEIERVASELLAGEKFLVSLGGEHSITPPLVAAASKRHRGLHVLQLDAHADLRDTYMGTPHNHACAMRRTLEHAAVTQLGIRSLSREEADAIPSLKTTVFYDQTMRQNPKWIEQVVASLGNPVYITVDVDVFDPALMPSTGTPEPGGLSWYEALTLLRAVFAQRTVVACDLVELSPMPPLVAPNFLCAKLVYKMLGYRFAGR
jgi:agmatinase